MTTASGSGTVGPAKVRIRHLQDAKGRGRPFTMLTSYDQFTARVFEAAGIDVLLVGDSVGTTVLGHESTTATTHQDMVTFTGAVARSVHRPLIVADLAFGTYQTGPADAVRHGVDLVRAGAEMVKLEGGQAFTEHVRALVDCGIPVMGHLGFTPQSVNALSGHRVQGRDQAAADSLAEDALALQEAGASAIVLELVPAAVSARITEVLAVPTIGIGAGPDCDGQVLVWQDMAGLSGFEGRFVKRFANLRAELQRAAAEYREEVTSRSYPAAEHSFE
ncbi:3-methyl-2-oxobutanoate hydroxymethyltransferase [Brachybacterium sp. p3-SID1565]|uniref:3-methyl-2-oxobutanoate hydroxymethyltransferase n=1 Tax=Brachybacterium epidermidis TaxID=2781983 RepID=A0ABR9W131_9MICO|nr:MULTISPECIES: 3-methyl-2-oxobutanoate hydroxymethyltransferase [Brachybacterium]MBE9404129.1 3-methyl-2-oxobutanoate hydroxymethyltransferase [Brachybacterium epidermidis]MCT1385306.1 3-methyl-2-oxobutanoate hydroxymethyltransferase [Brachybacterium sp. p3-SID1565]